MKKKFAIGLLLAAASSVSFAQSFFDNMPGGPPPKMPADDAAAAVPCVSGQPVAGPGGEVDRMERSKDGTLKLKRYMLTSRCVKGYVHTFLKPLD